MLSYQVYKVIHLVGIFLILMAFAAMVMINLSQVTWAKQAKKWVYANHGIGLLLALVGGFGLLARLYITWPWPSWVMAKMTIWLVAAGLAPLVVRTPKLARLWWVVVLALGGLAVAIVNFRGGV